MSTELTLEAFQQNLQAVPQGAVLGMLGVTALSMIDAYLIARRERQHPLDGTTQTCPHCGKEIDEDLDFCHWCTTKLDVEPDDEGRNGGLISR